MKQLSYLLTLFLLCGISFSGASQLLTETFETDGEGSRYTSNSFFTACDDYFARMQSSQIPGTYCITNIPSGQNGSFYWGGEDTDQATGGEAVLTLNAVAATGFDLDVDILLAHGRPNEGRCETADYFILEYNMDGAGWNIFGAMYGNNDAAPFNGNLQEDTDLNGSYNAGAPEVNSTAFQNFNFEIPVTGNSVQVRVRMLMNAGTEETVFDNIRINGTAACSEPTLPSIVSGPPVICDGNSALLTISGTLNGATQWSVYTGTCGGTLVGSTTGSTIIVTPTPPSTTYFIRGEGGCVTPGACTQITVTTTARADASFNYGASSYCVNDSDPTPTITGVSGGTFSALPGGLAISSGSGLIDLSTSTPGAYTVSYNAPGLCGLTESEMITINALDDASFNYSAASFCANESDPTPTITGLSGGTFSSTPGGLAISAGSGIIDLSVSAPGTYSVTYTTTGLCLNSSSNNVTVDALASSSFTALENLCIDAGAQIGNAGGSPVGGVYSGPGVTDDGNGLSYSFDPATAGVGVHTITYTPAGGCSSSASDMVEVFALPVVAFTALADVCLDAGVQAGSGSGTPTGGVYSGTGVTDNGDDTYDFDPAAAGVGVHTITYNYTNANGCSNSASDDVVVFALPVVSFTALADLCLNDGVQAGQGGGLPTGGVYSGPGVTDNGDDTYDFDPVAAGAGVHTITYDYTNANGCSNSASDDVEVFALPVVTFTAPGPFCETQGVQNGLGGATPAGGVYSGTAVTDDGNGMTYSFDPASAGLGTYTITYTVGIVCPASASDDVVVSAGVINAVCQDVTIYLDGSGNASITAADIDGGSSVGCGVLGLAASQTTFTCADISSGVPAPSNDLIITAAYDGPLSGGTPKGVEIYVVNNIADLSEYALGSANNGGGSDGIEFTFPAVAATAGQYIYVASEATQFTNFVGFAPDYTTGSMSINGDDAVELFYQGGVIDIFGDINTDGTGEVWDFLDGWAYRNDDTGNDGSAWNPSNWSFSGINALDGEATNATAATPIPFGTYSIQIAAPTGVTLTVTDGLGGSATCTANVTILDTVAPTITCATDITVDQDAGVCASDVTIPNIVTSDNCSGEVLSWIMTSSAGTSNGTGQLGVQTIPTGVATVDVTVTDGAGNTADCSFTITVNDTVAPTVPVLADSTAECTVTVTAPTTTDACAGAITGTTTDPLTYSSQGTFVVNWSFDDGSGNVSTATQNVIITDLTAPTASNVDTVFAECLGDVAIDITLVDDELDNCAAAPIVTYVGDVASNGTGCNDTIVRTYNVADDAGNNIDVTQIIIVNDTTAPTASNPLTLVVLCLSEVPAPSASWVTDEADNCGNPIVTYVGDVSSNGTGCSDTITRTFEVADACGNAIQVEQTIIINDDVAPVIDNASLADIVGFCDLTPATPTATDNCLGSVDGVADVTFPINTVGTTVVTWSFTDDCGNVSTQTQNVIVEQININTTFAPDGITIISSNNEAGVTFQWYNCTEDTLMTGETNINFTPIFSADFAVIVTQDGCSDTSDCVTISGVGLDQLTFENFTMYPNPTATGSFTISVEAPLQTVSVLDMTGRLVKVETNLTEKTVDVSNLVNGAYIVRVVTESGQSMIGTIRVQ